MCIFTNPVESVSNTQIFARRTPGQSQFVVYQMNYKSADPNAMILPIPIRRPIHSASLRFIDLSHYTDFFKHLNIGFPFTPRAPIGCGHPPSPAAASLHVFEVGNYLGSFVPSLNDFSRLDPRFTLPTTTWEKLPQYADYGFVVFQLAEGTLTPHPMAFSFDSAIDELYFPTLHIHDGEIHVSEKFAHTLYMQHAGFDSRVNEYRNADVPDASTGLIRSKRLAKEFCNIDQTQGIVTPELLVHRKFLDGLLPNQDTLLAVKGDPLATTWNMRPWLPWLQGSTVLVALAAWFFARRARIDRERQATLAEATIPTLTVEATTPPEPLSE